MSSRLASRLKAAPFVFVLIGGLLAATFYLPPKAAAAACAVPNTNYGMVTATLNVTNAGTYTIWTRMMAPDTTNNSYLLEIDGGTCYTVGNTAMTPNVWTWVDHKDGNVSSKITQNLAAGNHTLRLIGSEPSVKVDRILALSDACKPTGIGTDCTAVTDSADPTVTLNTPVEGSTVSGTVNVTATATDNVGVTKVEFYIDDQLKATDTSSPYAYSWDTTSVTNNVTHKVTAKAYDAVGRFQSDINNVTVKNGDSQAPTIPTNLKATATAFNKVLLTWTASTDNVGVASYTILRNGANLGSTTSTSFTDHQANATSSYNYQVVALDQAGNRSNPTPAVSITTPSAPDTQAPSVPINLVATAVSTSQINLTWTASTDNVGVNGYDIYRATGNGTASKIGSASSTTFGDTGLVSNTTYSYYLVARDAVGNMSQQSATAQATTHKVQPPTEQPSNQTGDIRGTVTGRWGRPIRNALIILTVNEKRFWSTTNNKGVYRFYDVPVGRHSIRVMASDYRRHTASVTVREDRLTIQNIRLNRR